MRHRRRGDAARLRPREPVQVVRRQGRRRARAGAARRLREAGVELRSLGDAVSALDCEARRVRTASGRVVAYDKLVLATGSSPFVPPVPGASCRAASSTARIDDLEAIRACAANGAKTAAVIGGGLLGLEAANALRALGLHDPRGRAGAAPDAAAARRRGGAVLRSAGSRRSACRCTLGKSTTREIVAGETAACAGCASPTASELPADMVVFSAGIRPRDELARAARLDVGERGGIVIDDRCRTSDPRRLRDRRVRAATTGRSTAWSRPATRWPRWPRDAAAAATTRVHRRRHEHEAQAARRRRGQLRRPLRHDAGRARVACSTTVARRLQEAGRLARTSKHLLGGMLVGDACGVRAARWRSCQTGAPLPDAPRGADLPAARGRQERPAWASTRCPTRPDLLLQQRRQGRHLRARSASRS